ncbi:hypothetical protein FRC12_019647 [Ceratobasidium sp. 428]|nr:hypothetical protein FRC12_019647 [Ceratobasidium sp. 428]
MDGNFIDLATQALQALMETQDELRNVLRSAGQTGNAGSNRRTAIDANIPRNPDGFTSQITATLVSRAPATPKRIAWTGTSGGAPEVPGQFYGNRNKWFAPYLHGKLSKCGKGSDRGRKRFPSTATVQTASIVVCSGTKTGPEPIKINEPGASPSIGPTGLDAGSSTHGVPTDADLSLESDDDCWNIPDYDEESW